MTSIVAIVLILISALAWPIETSVRFTNVKCKEFHPEFATMEKCDLKVVGRGIIALNIEVKLWQVPVSNVSVNLSLQKKLNGYRPFLYNVTFDFCKFMTRRKAQPFLKIFLDIILSNSNINHTCPYDHNIIVKNSTLNEEHFKYLPLPRGDYMFLLLVGAYNDWKAEIKMYFEITRDL